MVKELSFIGKKPRKRKSNDFLRPPFKRVGKRRKISFVERR